MTAAARSIPRLSSHWKDVARRIRASRHVVLFLDFDGTLAPLAARPERARLPSGTRRVLQRLIRHRGVTLIVISGRRRAELQRRVGIPGIQYWGLYGAETGQKFQPSGAERRALRSIRAQLARRLSAYTQAWVENKGASLTVHLRDVPEVLQFLIRRELRLLLHDSRRALRLFENLRDAEIAPRRVSGKGEAVRRFLARRRRGNTLAIYCGDDFSDESAFAAVRHGIPILVGPARPTWAQYRLCCPDEIAAALAKMEAALP
jgi:trehalose 6-phosphate phosphatase